MVIILVIVMTTRIIQLTRTSSLCLSILIVLQAGSDVFLGLHVTSSCSTISALIDNVTSVAFLNIRQGSFCWPNAVLREEYFHGIMFACVSQFKLNA